MILSTSKKCVKAYLKQSDYYIVQRIANEHNVSISAVIAGLLHFYRSYKYFPGCDYDFRTGAWVPDREDDD